MFTIDDDNAVIFIYRREIPGLYPSDKARILAALKRDLDAVRSYLSLLTNTPWRILETFVPPRGPGLSGEDIEEVPADEEES